MFPHHHSNQSFISHRDVATSAPSSDGGTIIHPSRLAQHVNDWLLHEMDIGQNRQTSQAMPSVSQIRDLCRGNMVDVWLYLLGNVYNARRVDTMKKNVLLNGNKAQEERMKKERRRQELLTQIQMTQQRIKQLKEMEIPNMTFELKQIKSELSALDLQESNREKRTATINQQNCILKCFDEKCASNHIVISDFGDRLDTVYQTLVQEHEIRLESAKMWQQTGHRTGQATTNTMTDDHYGDNDDAMDGAAPRTSIAAIGSGTESYDHQELAHTIQDACSQMERQYAEQLSKYVTPSEAVHQTVAQIARTRTGPMIQILSDLTSKDSDQIQSIMSSLSVQKDMSEIEARCERKQEKSEDNGDDTNANNDNHNYDTKHILTERRKEHIALYIDSEELLNQVSVKQSNLETKMSETRSQLNQIEPYRSAALGQLLQVEMKYNGLCSSKTILESRLAKLRELRDKYRSIYQSLELKRQQITNFNEQNNQKQSLIEDLMKDVLRIQRVIEDKKKIIHAILHTDLSEINSQFMSNIPGFVSTMQDGISRELKAFSNLPWYRLHPDSDQKLDVLHSQWLRKANLPDFTCIDALVAQMTDLQFEEYESRMNVQLHKHLMKKIQIECSNPTEEAINEVITASANLDHEQRSSWMQTIEQVTRECESIQKLFEETDQLAEEWWNKPASKLDLRQLLAEQ